MVCHFPQELLSPSHPFFPFTSHAYRPHWPLSPVGCPNKLPLLHLVVSFASSTSPLLRDLDVVLHLAFKPHHLRRNFLLWLFKMTCLAMIFLLLFIVRNKSGSRWATSGTTSYLVPAVLYVHVREIASWAPYVNYFQWHSVGTFLSGPVRIPLKDQQTLHFNSVDTSLSWLRPKGVERVGLETDVSTFACMYEERGTFGVMVGTVGLSALGLHTNL